ncbi:MAG: transporter substrate-binding domain-containing protein [Proteobacteria bacterium]|nr:transporter substrate-binding domain-containing protein [Pseudomonadota bacterium]
MGLLVAAGAAAEPTILRVGTSGDYPPFSHASTRIGFGEFQRQLFDDEVGRDLVGFDMAVARAYAADRGLRIRWIQFNWRQLLSDVNANRFDVVMSGITIRPERSAAGRFSLPVAESGAVLLVRDPDRWPDWKSLDHPAVRIAVNAGGHLERVARARLPRATLLAIPDNAAVRDALLAGNVNAALTDTVEAPLWRELDPELGELGPLTRDRKAYLVNTARPDLARDLDAWLLERERDGSLAKWRGEHLGAEASPKSASVLPALVAAMDERLAVMPLVALAKRETGIPVAALRQEEKVLARAASAATAAAESLGLPPLPAKVIEACFRAQMEAAKQLQRVTLDTTPLEVAAPFDLDAALRPALARISERLTWLLVQVPAEADAERLQALVRTGLRAPELADEHRDAIAASLVAIAQARAALAAEEADAEAGE